MKKNKIKILLFFLFVNLIKIFPATEIKNIRAGNGTLTNGLQITAVDEKFQINSTWLSSCYSTSHEALVRFGLDETKHKVYANFNAQIQVNIKGYDVNGAQLLNISPTLYLNYTQAGTYVDMAVYKIGNYPKIEVTVMNIYSNIAIPQELFLEAEVATTRYYKFPSANYIPSTLPAGFNYNIISKPCQSGPCISEIEVYWQYFQGAEEYELEWTWVNSYPGAPLQYDFRTDATRITTMNNHYRIPINYEMGFLVFRMRGIGKKGPAISDRVEGYWTNTGTFLDYGSVANYPSNFKYQIAPGNQHTIDFMNWSSTMTFAEDGKKGAGISYMDGMLMSRQSQAKLNTENKTIVQQTLYDYQGRPAISVLPAPISNYFFAYNNNLSKNTSLVPYSKDDFDPDAACLNSTQPMDISVSTGAANYYSPNNTNKTGMQGYVPDAKQYPFVQVEYAPDKTGRIIAQSMPGDAHKLGSGHETKFYYSNPSDAELKRLFGSDAGNAGHYDKNMVKDANGQISTTYKDMSGKVVATALMGSKPAAVDAIADYNNTEALVDDLTTFNKTDQNNYTIISSKNIFIETPGSIQTFKYEFTPQDYNDAACAPSKCFDCLYEIEIKITDECNSFVLAPVTALVGSILPINSSNVGNCDSPTNTLFNLTPVPLSVTFPASGTYKVVKTLKVSDAPIAQYVAEYLSTGNSCIKTLQQFINEQTALIDFSSCGGSCQSCSTAVNTYISNHPPNTLTPTQITQLLQNCGQLCASYDPCESSRKAMLSDFYPGGQYATYTAVLGVYSSCSDFASIFHSTPSIGIKYNQVVYPPAMWPLYPFNTGIAPKDPATMTPADYIKYYKKEWATLFMNYHPEKVYLDFCSLNKLSDQYDYEMLQVNSFDEACAKGYVKPLNGQTSTCLSGCTITNYDPFFNTGGQGLNNNSLISDAAFTDVYGNTVAGYTARGYTYKSFMDYAFNVSYPISSNPVNINTNLPIYTLAKIQAGNTSSGFGCDPCTKDKEWLMFRALYLNYKMRLVAQRKTDYVMSITPANTSGFNGCMVSSGLNSTANPFVPSTPNNIINSGPSSMLPSSPPINPTSLNFLPFTFGNVGAPLNNFTQYTFMGYPVGKTPSPSVPPNCATTTFYYDPWGLSCNGTGDIKQPCSSLNNGVFNSKIARFPQLSFDVSSLINNYNSSSPTPNNTMPVVANVIPSPLPAATANYCNDLCTSYADEWLTKLKDCNLSINPDPNDLGYTFLNPDINNTAYNPTFLGYVKTDLINVCKRGCDASNPFGSSSVSPANIVGTPASTSVSPTSYYNNFTQVLTSHFGSANANCDVNLLSMPKPYGSNVSGTNGNPSKLDTCGCNKVLSAKYYFLNSTLPAGVTTAQQYFQYVYGNQLPNFSEIECKCTSAWNSTSPPNTWYTTTQVNNVNWTPAQQTALSSTGVVFVPSFLDCTKPCIPCTTVVNAINGYNAANPTYQASNNYSTLLTNYLNNLFDFNLGISDYLDFYNDCSLNIPVNCPQFAISTKLKGLVNDWIAYYQNNPTCLTPPVPSFYNVNGPTGIPNLFNSVGTPDFLTSCTVPNAAPTSNGLINPPPGPLINFSSGGAGVLFRNIIDASIGMACGDCLLLFDGMLMPQNPAPVCTNVSFNIANNILVNNSSPQIFYNFIFVLNNNSTGFGYFSCLPAVVPCYNQNMLCDKPIPNAPIVNDCASNMLNNAYNNALNLYNQQVTAVTDDFKRRYKDKCLQITNEKFERNYNLNEYHYTLYYYDQAGNLTRTIPPKGVTLLAPAQYNTVPTHKYATAYSYQSYGAPIVSQSPDENFGTNYIYDKIGRIVASSNGKQQYTSGGPYSSYTIYDALGRIIEVGEVNRSLTQLQTVVDAGSSIKSISGAVFTQVIQTQYDQSLNATVAGYFPGSVQLNLRNRVASVTYEDTDDNNTATYKHATHYSYDEHGNVKNMVQENGAIGNLGNKDFTMEYDYDIISGNVNTVSFQKGRNDQFFHKYEYDDDNRLHIVLTSKDGFVWDRDAKYFYYDHGPLGRKELGEQKVHAEDFAYTIQGWIKAVNSNMLSTTTDIGKDGDISAYSATVNNIHNYFGRDAFGYSLNYFGQGVYKDYQAIKNANFNSSNDKNLLASITNISTGSGLFDLQLDAPDLYNGNISSMVTSIIDKDPTSIIADNSPFPQLTAYKYDQLHRIKQMKAYRDFDFNTNPNTWKSLGTYDNSYESNFTYDKNGNILTHNRNGISNNIVNGSFVAMDNMTYIYNANGSTINTNKLIGVNDVANTSAYTTDIKGTSAAVAGNPGTFDYDYDNIGNLIKDNKEFISEIKWTVDRKVAAVIRNRVAMFAAGKNLPDLFFEYDANRQRVAKIEKQIVNSGPTYPYVAENNWKTTYYVRDASGNIMATYSKEFTFVNGNNYTYRINAKEFDVYGSSRIGNTERASTAYVGIGNFNNNTAVYTGMAYPMPLSLGAQMALHNLGKANYELSNHLGNVITVISDRKIGVDAPVANGIIDYYLADIKETHDYYPFGYEMPGRTIGSDFAYNFNGKRDDKWNGNGSSYGDFGARMMDNRLGRWMSVDPKAGKFPNESHYAFCSDNPIVYVDPDGKEKVIVIGGGDNTGADRYKFINSGVRQLLDYAANNAKNEPITIVITDKFVEAEVYEYLETWANATAINNNIKVNIVKANSGDEITNYINSKSTAGGTLSEARKGDLLTGVAFFGHGYNPYCSSEGGVGCFEPGHGTPGEDIDDAPSTRPEHNKWAWGVDEVANLDPVAFKDNCNIDFYSCNAGTPNAEGNSLVLDVSKQVPQANVSGYFGRTDYIKIYDFISKMQKAINGGLFPASSLPVGGKKSGGKAGDGPAEKIKAKGGKTTPSF